MFEFLDKLAHRITVGSMDFRKSVSEMLDKANQGYAVVITVNNKPKAVLVAPQVADQFFAEHEQVLTAGDGNEDYQPLNGETLAAQLPDCPACLGQSTMHETLTKQHPTDSDIPSEAKVFDETGKPVENPSAQTLPQDVTPAVEPKSAITIQPDKAPVMEQPVDVVNQGETHETPAASAVETPAESSSTNESTTEAPVASSEVAPEAGQTAPVNTQTETVEQSATEPEPASGSESQTEAPTNPQDEPAADVLTNGPTCQASLVVPTVVCEEPAIKRVNWRGVDINICAKHLGQLNEKNQVYTDLGNPV